MTQSISSADFPAIEKEMRRVIKENALLKRFTLPRQEAYAYMKERGEACKMELFAIMDEGPGFPFFLPKGMVLKNTWIDYWRSIHEREGYQEISTPILLNRQLWETSGHWDHYQENMYTTRIDEVYSRSGLMRNIWERMG